MNNKIVQRIATKAVVTRSDGKFVLLREANTYEEGTNIGRWNMPGGRLDIGENFESGLKRELFEETGLKVEIIKPLYVGEWRPIIKGVQNQIVGILFLCESKPGNIVLSQDHDAYKWVSAKEALELDIMEPEDIVIKKYDEVKK